jgi:hypothetical protein
MIYNRRDFINHCNRSTRIRHSNISNFYFPGFGNEFRIRCVVGYVSGFKHLRYHRVKCRIRSWGSYCGGFVLAACLRNNKEEKRAKGWGYQRLAKPLNA